MNSEPKRIWKTLITPTKLQLIPIEVKLSLVVLTIIFFIYAQAPTLFPQASPDVIRGELTFYLLMVIVSSMYLKKRPLDRVKPKRAMCEFGAFAFITWFVFYGLYGVSELMPLPTMQVNPMVIFALCFVGAYGEELFFRSLLQREWGIILTSIVFTLAFHLHFATGTTIGSPILSFVALFIFSVILGVVYDKFKSIYPSIGIHFTFNIFMITMVAQVI